eukprot:TRINITY_DN15572_c0_g1_i1.p1 TRINITY_DN15572_c0_g1~~TRINITY_DN15572_c0_g1_i1.p1  ORF type:complete len:368 (+),score=51.18 TRINITY_DN15572_c0_g1_i1:3-1106(+)
MKEKFISLFNYRTVKLIEIKSWKLGLLYYFISLCIVAYVIGFVIIYHKQYQTVSLPVGISNLKPKGNGYFFRPNTTMVVWDEYDICPIVENNGLFITTTMHPTYHQQRTIYSSTSLKCDPQEKCPIYKETENGRTNGVCDETTNYCQVSGWYPLENPYSENYTITGSQNVSIFIKNNVKFSELNINMDNLGGMTPIQYDYLNPNNKSNSLASIWRMEDIINLSGSKYEDITDLGAAIVASFTWNCDFDFSKICHPNVSFLRVDNPNSDSKGFNFRIGRQYYSQENTSQILTRDLIKYLGVKIFVVTAGSGGKFTSPVPFFQALGAGLSLLAASTVIADMLLIYILPKRYYYKENKINEIDDISVIDY